MGKAGIRRRRSRQKYLAWLAATNPKRFTIEWSKRLESWSIVTLEKAETGQAHEMFEAVLNELQACGPEAVRLEGEKTATIMRAVCSRAVAQVVDPRMYRLRSSLPCPDGR
ncbi:MAG: hypothetical protein L3J03_08235 [Desulfobacterales bacterium]|nr:hypothetical protein [Desulfobacterales bacterium]